VKLRQENPEFQVSLGYILKIVLECNKARKANKRHQTGKKQKILFVDNMIIYVENLMESKKLPKLIK
jgi:hypothetical protein